jgi:hypothetical protein
MRVSKKYFAILNCGLIIIIVLVCLCSPKEKLVQSKPVINKTALIPENDSIVLDTNACSQTEVKLFLKEFIKKFNTNKASDLNVFINKTKGVAIFVRDGYYPILSFPDGIDDWIEWFDFKIYDNVEFDKFPKYLGDGEFEKTGFYCVKYEDKFRLDDFEDTYSNRSDEDKSPFRQLEKICNYRADVMSIDKTKVLTLYFSIYKSNKYLVGITKDAVDDVLYIDQEKEIIAIDTEEQVEEFLSNNRRFCDEENKAYVDFDKKEIIYWDFGDKPYPFSDYTMGPVNVISAKIKIRDIKFFNLGEEDEGFTLKLSNKGNFSSYRMGARPQYIYEKCK